MKNRRTLSLLSCVAFATLLSCQDDLALVNNETSPANEAVDLNGVVYPSSKFYRPMTKGTTGNFETDWETMDEIEIPGQEGGIYTPWSSKISDSNLPYEFAYDVKKEDGWKMLLHTFNVADEKMRYIVLYNQRTGIMKVFYYLVNEAFLNNGGAWEVEFTTSQALFNHTGELAIPINLSKVNHWGCTNVVKAENKAFYLGWNGFQIQLAYTPNTNSDNKFDVNSRCLNTADLNLFGSNYSYSEGTILTHGSSNPLSGLASDLTAVFGSSAEDFIDDQISSGKLKGKTESVSTKSLVGGIAGAVVNFGANLIFNAFTSSFSQSTTSKMDLQFITKGEIKIQGDLSFDSNGPAKALRTLFTKDLVGELGVWNLAEQPIIYLDPRADYVPNPPFDEMWHEYNYQLRGVSRYDYDLMVNPDLKPYIKDQWVEIELVRYWQGLGAPEVPDIYEFGSLGGRMNGFEGNIYKESDLIYGNHQDSIFIYREPMAYTVYSKFGPTPEGEYLDPVPTVFVPNMPTYTYRKFNSENIFLKMSLYLVTEFEGKEETTISTRTFIPKIEWDPVLYDQLKDVPLEELSSYNDL